MTGSTFQKDLAQINLAFDGLHERIIQLENLNDRILEDFRSLKRRVCRFQDRILYGLNG